MASRRGPNEHVTPGLLDRASSVPLWRQLEDILRAELPHSRATGFTEHDLTARFRVSRYTVRQALDVLRREGLIERQKKRGTFPSAPAPIQQPLEGMYSFGRSMAGLGLSPNSRVLSLRSMQPDGSLGEQLRVSPAVDTLVELIRLRSAGGQPLVLESIWLAEAAVPNIADEDLSGSVYDLLRDRYGLDVDSAQESIRPVVLGARHARLLGARKGSPAFFVERVSSVGDRRVEVRHSVIRGDRYLYSIQLRQVRCRCTQQRTCTRSTASCIMSSESN